MQQPNARTLWSAERDLQRPSSPGHLQIKIDMIRISNTTCCHTLDTKFENIDFEGTESFPKFGFEPIAISDLKNIKHNLLQLMKFSIWF